MQTVLVILAELVNDLLKFRFGRRPPPVDVTERLGRPRSLFANAPRAPGPSARNRAGYCWRCSIQIGRTSLT
eukprot:5809198-Pyramimonas_sp.AAC.1